MSVITGENIKFIKENIKNMNYLEIAKSLNITKRQFNKILISIVVKDPERRINIEKLYKYYCDS
jgi:hypothetical protein